MKRFPLWHLALVAVLCILTYANTVSGAYVWDDEVQIVKNANLRSLSNIPAAFTEPFWGFAGVSQTNFYRPIQTVLYTLAYAWGGLDPTAGHIINLGLHVLASVFVYLICVELGFLPAVSLLASALFAVHPIHTEAIAWIAAAPDVACGAFYFASFWAFLRSDHGARLNWLILSALLLFPALLSKEMAITLPVLVALYSFPRLTLKLFAPYAIVTAVYLAMRANALGFLATTHTQIEASYLDWITLGIRVFGQYLWQVLVPYPLVAYHLIELHLADRVVETALALGFTLALAALAWRFREGRLWFIAFALMLTPVFYFKGISNALLSERYLYVPSLAFAILAGALVTRFSKAVWPAWALVGIFAVSAIARNLDWQDSEHLYVTTLERNPEVAHIRINLAEILLKRGDDRNATQHLNAALDAMTSKKYSQVPYDYYRAHIGLGAILARARNYPEARQHLETAKQSSPQGEWPYLYLGGIAMEADNDIPKAIELLQTAVRLGPLNETARDYLGVAYFNQGRIPEAKVEFEEALKINPTHVDARAHLEMANKALAQSPPIP